MLTQFSDTIVAMQGCAHTFATVMPRSYWSGLMLRLKGHFITTPLFYLIAFLLEPGLWAFRGRIRFCPKQIILSGCLTSLL